MYSISRMTFASEPMETDLEDSLSCTHLVCCRLNMGSVFHRDDRDIVDEEEYMPDPYTGKREVSCASCCLLYTSPSPRDVEESRMPSSA